MFKKIKQIWVTALYNFRLWRNNPRILTAFALAFIFAFLLSEKAVSYGIAFDTTMQACEAFLWTFGDGPSIMIASSLLIFLFSDMPRLDSSTPFFLMRTTKKCWIIGQILYIMLSSLLYVCFVFISTVILSMKNSFLGNMWSQTAAMLGYSTAGSKLSIPSTVRVMERSTPYLCTVQICLLMVLYCISMVLFMLVLYIRFGRRSSIAGSILYGLAGLLLNPKVIQALLGEQIPIWKINVLAGWISPLNHATYSMHSFGYDKLPTITQSYLVLSGFILICFGLLLYQVKHYNFEFSRR